MKFYKKHISIKERSKDLYLRYFSLIYDRDGAIEPVDSFTLYKDYLTYSDFNGNNERHRFAVNSCSRAISVLQNICFLDLSYDLLYMDIVHFPKDNEVGASIYCKKTGNDWKLMWSKIIKDI